MIKFALCCAEGHKFDAWFRSGDTYDRQARRKLISCPECGSNSIDKQPMAPALVKSAKARTSRAVSEVPAAAAPSMELLRAFKQHVLNNTEDVGTRFAEEALRMHHGESEPRAIRGAATAEDAAALQDEGVAFGLLPILPEDRN